MAPADTFLTCMTTRTRSRCKLGLTATLVREDGKIDVLNDQIGPKVDSSLPPRPTSHHSHCRQTPLSTRPYPRKTSPLAEAVRGQLARLATLRIHR